MITESQLSLIKTQIGREPRGVVSVAVEKNGIPVVLQMRSLLDDKPFPTLYWLTSKTLYKAIATIETEGWVKKLEVMLHESSDFLTQYQRNQQDYIASRWSKMSLEDRSQIDSLGYSPLFNKLGIGGLSDHGTIRCLHMHYAHHLAENNVIGDFLDKEFQLNHLDLVR